MGSSANRIRGELANARAIATRCCSPPDSCVGKVIEPIAESDAAQQLARTLAGAALAAQLERHLHVLERRERGDQLKALEDEPNFLAPQLRALVLVHRRQVGAVEDAPVRAIGVSRPARRPSSVVLPLPDGPTMATNAPCGIENDTSRRTVEPVLAAAIFLGQITGDEHEDAGRGKRGGAERGICGRRRWSPLAVFACSKTQRGVQDGIQRSSGSPLENLAPQPTSSAPRSPLLASPPTDHSVRGHQPHGGSRARRRQRLSDAHSAEDRLGGVGVRGRERGCQR